ncbi:phosphoribosyltransferase family protein [Cytobacillus firmus]|uniref:phosphoribosyltransferase family protein n=1 Tax=Cytobacillus firmus TaxID=1399 RepID=UPI002161F8EF|nr:phosphoribosyltransferase family protein [Cytobacillus firmus]MCS0672126.1 phosphoribosyltransferase family protein [Cytobacillus firmus]
MRSHTLTFSKTKHSIQILNSLTVDIQITDNPYELALEDLFVMAARINKKRSFLFVSKVLGKHIPINPQIGLLTGELLASRYMEKVKKVETGKGAELLTAFKNRSGIISSSPFIHEDHNPVIVGFAETATALGHAFFQSFKRADYFHTTREQLIDRNSVITFEEEHSHATSHRCYTNESLLDNKREIILVDDEMTTGKTAINIIRSIHERFPRKIYTVVSILDWRSLKNQILFDDLEKELGIIIHSVSLLKGEIDVKGSPEVHESQSSDELKGNDGLISYIHINNEFPELLSPMNEPSAALSGEIRTIPYLKDSGRFGLDAKRQARLSVSLAEIGQYLFRKRDGRNTLCLGTGEFMYIPMKLASLMGEGVKFHSTTRSPIFVRNDNEYGAKYGISFQNPEDPEMAQFVYNIPEDYYEELFLFFEREPEKDSLMPFINQLKKYIKNIKIVCFNGGETNE